MLVQIVLCMNMTFLVISPDPVSKMLWVFSLRRWTVSTILVMSVTAHCLENPRMLNEA